MNQHLLYICQNALGDIITSLPSIHFLKNTCNHVDILVSEAFPDLFAADPHIDHLIYFPPEWFDTGSDNRSHYPIDLQTKILSERYDVIVDSLCTPSTTELVQLHNPSLAIGIEFGESLYAYNRMVSVERWRSWSDGTRTASDCFGDLVRAYCLEYTATPPKLFVCEEAEFWAREWLRNQGINALGKQMVALNPGAGNVAKCWPFERYLELADWLQREQYTVLFLFGPKETALFQAHIDTLDRIGANAIYFSDSRIQRLAGLLRHSSLTISNDCAVMHISAAIGCPTLAIFGPSNSKIWFPYDRETNCIVERAVSCRQYCISGCDVPVCLTDISVSDVASVALRMLTLSTYLQPVGLSSKTKS